MKFILTFILFLFTHISFCQSFRLEGKIPVVDTLMSIGQITVFNLPDSNLVKGSYIDSSYFSFFVPEQSSGSYYANLKIPGYVDTVLTFQQNDSVVNLGIIQLDKDRQLTTVDVVYREPLYERTINGIEVNVGGTTLETLENLFEILKASPRLMSPDDESIEIIGKGTPLILVDRQPIISVEELKAIPANMVDKIEIITNPPAKYRAQGKGGGVIEVFTKDFHLEGYNMNISASGGTNTQLRPAGSLSLGLSLKKRKFSLNANLNGNYNARYAYGWTDQQFTDDSQRANNWNFNNDGWNLWQHGSLKSSYQISEKQKLSFGFRGGGSFSGYDNHSSNYYYQYDSLQTNEEKNTTAGNTWANTTSFLSYYLETDTNKSNLEINFNYQYKVDRGVAVYHSDYFNIPEDTLVLFDLKKDSRSKPNIGEIKVYYEHIFDTTGWSLNTGGSYNLIYNGQRYFNYNLEDGNWVEDPVFTNSYNYTEQIGSVFFEVSKNWNKFSARAGITGEVTYLHGYSHSLNKLFIDSTYVLPFPSASIMYSPVKDFSVTVGYTGAIDRPSFSRFDPFVRIIDSLNIEYGNPYLKPSYTHQAILEFNLFNTVTVGAEYMYKDRPVADNTFVPAGNFILNTTPQNADNSQNLTLSLSSPVKIGKWLTGCNSVYFDYANYAFTPEFNRAPYSNITYSLWSNLNFHLKGDVTINNRIYLFQWGTDNVTGKPALSWGMRVTKKFNNKLQLYLDVSNITPTVYRANGVGANFTNISKSQYQFTTFKLGIFFKFGRLRNDTNIKESSSGQSERI